MKIFIKLILSIFLCFISCATQASDKSFIYTPANTDINIDFLKNDFHENIIEFNNENNTPCIRNNRNQRISAFKNRKQNILPNGKSTNSIQNFTVLKYDYFYKVTLCNSYKISSLLENEISTRAP